MPSGRSRSFWCCGRWPFVFFGVNATELVRPRAVFGPRAKLSARPSGRGARGRPHRGPLPRGRRRVAVRGDPPGRRGRGARPGAAPGRRPGARPVGDCLRPALNFGGWTVDEIHSQISQETWGNHENP